MGGILIFNLSMDIPCDSGYVSAEGENDSVMDGLAMSANDASNMMEENQDTEQ